MTSYYDDSEMKSTSQSDSNWVTPQAADKVEHMGGWADRMQLKALTLQGPSIYTVVKDGEQYTIDPLSEFQVSHEFPHNGASALLLWYPPRVEI